MMATYSVAEVEEEGSGCLAVDFAGRVGMQGHCDRMSEWFRRVREARVRMKVSLMKTLNEIG